MTYPQALAYIASLEPRGWRLGLDRMQEFLRRANLEDAVGSAGNRNFIHVTGTNGKGSVTAFLQSMLVEQGYRTGTFFSPFVYDPRERVQFGREMIAENDVARLTEQLMPAAESLADTEFGGATEFEFKTALGFAYWKERKCEWVALEVGLGGRLDATNVVHSKVCVIVSVGLDHTAILGNTVEAIAHEKAGIIKPGVPVIVGEVPRTALEVIEEIAAQQQAPIWRFGREISLRREDDGFLITTPAAIVSGLSPGLVGAKQAHNMALAIAAMQVAGAVHDPSCLNEAACKTNLPGRFERILIDGTQVVLDGAHNPDAATVLRENLDEFFPGRHFVLLTGMVAGHDPVHYYERFKGLISEAHLVPISFHRGLKPEELATGVKKLFAKVRVHNSLEVGIHQALAATPEHGVLVVSGSFYLVGEVGAALRRIQMAPNPA